MRTKSKKSKSKKWSVAAAKKRNPAAFKARRQDPHEVVTPIVDVSLNAKEVGTLARIGVSAVPATNRDLAGVFAFEAKTYRQANSWARNSIRKIIRERLAKRVGDGQYLVTHRGTAFLNATRGVVRGQLASRFGAKSATKATAKRTTRKAA